jgi:small subunit ribosomal protein S18
MNIRKSRKDALLAAKRRGKEKGCIFCKTNKTPTWQDYESLNIYLSARGRIIGSAYTGVCKKHQRKLVTAIKHARHLALMPFTTQL